MFYIFEERRQKKQIQNTEHRMKNVKDGFENKND